MGHQTFSKQIDRFNSLEVTDSSALDVYVTDDATKRGQFKGYYKRQFSMKLLCLIKKWHESKEWWTFEMLTKRSLPFNAIMTMIRRPLTTC